MSEAAHDAVAALTGGAGVMDVLSKMLRGMFTAAPGHVLVGADFSNVEGRVAAWLADEHWKLRAFRDYDAGTGPDLYKVAYSRTFGVPVEAVTKLQRQKGGKTQELALGYQGSVGAWLRFDPDPAAVVALATERFAGTAEWLKAEEQHDRLRFHNGLPRASWVALKVIVNGWRATNPLITATWWAMQDAVVDAVDRPGEAVPVCAGRVRYMVSDGCLWTRLPSGKLLAYANPRVVTRRDDWLVDPEGNAVPADEMAADEVELRVAAGCVLQKGRERLQVAYDGKDQKTGRWERQYLYGGNLMNNTVQATARELLRVAMHAVEARGWPVVLHVHDEVVSEVPEALRDGIETSYQDVMSALPAWAGGLPLAAKAWSDMRYVK